MAMTQLSAPVMPGQWKTEEGVMRARERERGVTVICENERATGGFRLAASNLAR